VKVENGLCEDLYEQQGLKANQAVYEKEQNLDKEHREGASNCSAPVLPVTKKVKYSVWSPGQNHTEPVIIDNLPPPPTYNEVMSSEPSTAVARPTFCAKTTPYEIYTPGKSQDASTDMPQIVAPCAEVRKMFSAPKPKFVTNAAPAKWVPGST